MTVTSEKTGSVLTVFVEGRLDTVAAPKLDGFLAENLADASELVFDFEKLEYISSSGLRTLLKAQKKLGPGAVRVRRVQEIVREVFELTGFDSILTLED